MQEAQNFTQQIQERAINLIDTLALQLGVAAEHVYAVLSRQVVLEAVVTLVTIFALIVFTTAAAYVAARAFRWIQALDGMPSDGQEVMTIISVVLALILIIVTTAVIFSEGPTAIMKLVNPEYYVIKELLSVF